MFISSVISSSYVFFAYSKIQSLYLNKLDIQKHWIPDLILNVLEYFLFIWSFC